MNKSIGDNNNYAFEIKLTHSGTEFFKKVIGFIHNVISECNIIFLPSSNDNGGIHIKTLTNNKSKLIELNLNSNIFEYFVCDKPENEIKMGIDVNHLHNLLSLFGNDESIILYMIKKKEYALNIKNIEGNKNIETELLNLEDLCDDKTQIQLPSNKITMKSNEFHAVCKIFRRVFVDQINISLVTNSKQNNKILFESSANYGKVRISYDNINPSKDYSSNQTICNMYESQELINVSNCYELCDAIDIYLEKDFPLILNMSLSMFGKMNIFITPCEKH
jgi:hypothetical protein